MSSKPKTTAVEVTTSPTVTWETVRSGLATVEALGKTYLLGKAFVGWQLSVLKSQNCRIGAGRPKNSAESAELISWPELVERETGLKRRAADELIRVWEAGLAKHKRLRGPLKTTALIQYLGSTDPLALAADSTQAADFIDHFSSILDGETAASLMAELGVIPKPLPMPKPTGGTKPKGGSETAGQLAFHFFEAMVAPVINARTNPNYKKLLFALPLTSDDDHPISLATMKAEAKALLADIEDAERAAIQHSARPAKGRTL